MARRFRWLELGKDREDAATAAPVAEAPKRRIELEGHAREQLPQDAAPPPAKVKAAKAPARELPLARKDSSYDIEARMAVAKQRAEIEQRKKRAVSRALESGIAIVLTILYIILHIVFDLGEP